MLQKLRSAVEIASHLPRYKQIVQVLSKYGFGDGLNLAALRKSLGLESAELPAHDSGLLSNPALEPYLLLQTPPTLPTHP